MRRSGAKGKSALGGVAQKMKRRDRIINKGADQQPADELDDVFDE